MPIRAENRSRYPKDWHAISRSIRERSGGRCEFTETNGLRCEALNGQPHPLTGSRVVLTVAHLGLPAQLPFLFHVAGDAMADEVVELIGFLMPRHSEGPEWRAMMHDRATTEFLRGPTTSRAGFFVALPRRAPSLLPSRPIIFGAQAAAPVWVRLTDWRLLAEPPQAARIAAETAASAKIETTGLEATTASFACAGTKPAPRAAYCFRMAGIRTGSAAIRSLLRCDWEPLATDGAVDVGRGFARSGHASLYHIEDYPENCDPANLLAGCQRCHNRYDAPMRRRGIAERQRATLAAGDLFLCK